MHTCLTSHTSLKTIYSVVHTDMLRNIAASIRYTYTQYIHFDRLMFKVLYSSTSQTFNTTLQLCNNMFDSVSLSQIKLSHVLWGQPAFGNLCHRYNAEHHYSMIA